MTSAPFHAPFTIREAEFALYFADKTGMRSGNEAFVTGNVENTEIELSYQQQRSDVHGRPYGRIRHTDEQHSISFGHIWSLKKATGRMFYPKRDQQYIIVIRWHDHESQTWHKRTYFAVTAGGERLSHSMESYLQDVPFSAMWCRRSEGIGEPPSMLPETSGVVSYVSEFESLELYDYDPLTHIFAPIEEGLLPARATIIEQAGVLEVAFDGMPALRIAGGLLEAMAFTALGGTFLVGGSSYPRLEFRYGPMLHGTLSSAGEFAVPNLAEQDVAPDWENHFEFRIGGIWQASLGQEGLAAIEISEFLNEY